MKRIVDTFDEHYVVDDATCCWNWRRAVGSHGYGVLWVDGKMELAHRFSYERTHGRIPAGLQACHSCDNRKCVNPGHIWPGTDRDNKQDALRKGRGRRGVHRGEANKLAKLTAQDVLDIRAAVATGESQTAVAKRYGLHKTNVSCIIRRVTWAHLASPL